jgi:hypothetical protein
MRTGDGEVASEVQKVDMPHVDHSVAFVPLASGYFQSPELSRVEGLSILACWSKL